MAKRDLKVRIQVEHGGDEDLDGHIEWWEDLPPPDLIQHEGKVFRWTRSLLGDVALYSVSQAPVVPTVVVP